MIAATRRLIRAAVLEGWTAAGCDPERLGAENRAQTPTADGRLWTAETYRPGTERLVGIGSPRQLAGAPFYQLTVHAPPDEGTPRLDALAEAMARAFRLGHTLTASAVAGDAAAVRVVCDTFDPGPVLPGVAKGWTARALRIGLSTRRWVDAATGAPVPFAVLRAAERGVAA